MTDNPLATLYQSLDLHRPASLEALLASVSLLLPILDATLCFAAPPWPADMRVLELAV